MPLTPKVFDTLLILVTNSGRIVEKEELNESALAGYFCRRVESDLQYSTTPKGIQRQCKAPEVY